MFGDNEIVTCTIVRFFLASDCMTNNSTTELLGIFNLLGIFDIVVNDCEMH